MTMRRIAAWTILLLCALASSGEAAAGVWTVEKDGSGDFTIIQDAVDAAAPGDSILIGPGRYDAFGFAASTVDGFLLSAIVWVTTPDLTIVGSGPELSIIGPDHYMHTEGGRPAGAVYLDGGCTGLVLSALAAENTRGNITVRDDVALIESCRMTSPDPAAAASMTFIEGFDTVVQDCAFIGENGLLTGSGSGRIVIDSCNYVSTSTNSTGFSIGNGAPDCIVRNCTTTGGGVGVSVYLGASALIEGCVVDAANGFGVSVSGGIAVLRNSHIGVTRIGLRVSGRLEVYNSLIEGGTDYTVASTGDVYIRGSHILNAGGLSLLGSTSTPGQQNDLRHNWWGTADESLVESWILDEDGTVLWQPIESAPVPTGSKSMGSMKSSFHGN